MFSLGKYFLAQKYNFLRDAANVRRKLRKYSGLPKTEYPLPSGLSQNDEMQLMMGNVVRSLAIWETVFSLGSAKRASLGGLDEAKRTLESLTKQCEIWGIKV